MNCMLYQTNQGLKIIPTVGLAGFVNGDIDIGLKNAGTCVIYAMYKYSVKEAAFSEARYQLWSFGDDNKLSVRFNFSIQAFFFKRPNLKFLERLTLILLKSRSRVHRAIPVSYDVQEGPFFLVKTKRYLDVVSTSFERCGRQINVETTLLILIIHSVQNSRRRQMHHVSLSSIHHQTKYRMSKKWSSYRHVFHVKNNR